MKRRDFIKGSAIIGASVAVPSFLHSCSAMFTQTGNRKIRSVLNMKKVNVGTLPVLRAFAGDHTDYVSPFVLFDEFGPVNITPGADALKVGAHPHAGVTPTTFFLDGSGHHKDSLDYDFQVNKGEFMMFNSGKGAIHMEESGEELKQNGGNLHGFQIWLNMPSKHKFDDPTTVVFKDEAMPTIVHRKFTAQVVLGELFKRKSSIETLSPAFYYHIKLHADNRLDIPVDPTHNAFLYTVKGKLELEGQRNIKEHQLVLFERGESNINIYSQEGTEFFLLGGQPLDEVVYSYGPFVMNNREQIMKCYQDYRTGKMGDPSKVN